MKKPEGETIYIKHSNLMLEVGVAAGRPPRLLLLPLSCTSAPSLRQDLEKTQTQTLRHHNSISELKRSFMESLPEARPSEWDKRLSGSSPFRTVSTVSAGEQLQPSVSRRSLAVSLAEEDGGGATKLSLGLSAPSSLRS